MSAEEPQHDEPAGTEAPPTEDRYRPGQVLASKYLLIRLLGKGGMGSVWLAQNLVLEVEVAIKLLRIEHENQLAANRLLQEARAAARLGHPSIVRVFDFGETTRGDPFIVMEVLQGESLGDLLDRRERLSPISAAQTLLPVMSALSAAHDKGIVHRDLKPDNVMLVREANGGRLPKVVDFGIAKLSDVDPRASITKDGEVVGSPAYLSPQQAQGLPVDERADIWSMAVLYYEVISGRFPFDGKNYQGLLAAILIKDPRPLLTADGGDDALWEILAKGLQKQPEDRWPTMRAFGTAVAEWALARGVDVDVTGGSLRAHWIASSEPRFRSDAPTLAPPSEAPSTLLPAVNVATPLPRQRRALLPLVAAVVGLAILAVVSAGLLGRAPPPTPAAATATAAATPLEPIPPAISAPPAAISAPLAATSAALAATSAAPSASAAAPHKPPTTGPRKKPPGDMPLPSQPNF